MSRSRILSSIAAAGLGIALLGACSAESLAERAVGFGLEQAIEGDQDIDLNFDDGAGGFSISTDEGDFAINFDEENGGIVFDTDEGSGVISFDEDGIVYDTDEGEGVISFDQENGSINFDTDQGDGAINFDEDAGTVTFETEDGEVGIIGSTDMPADWPFGTPSTLVPGSTSFSTFNMGTDEGTMITGSFAHAENDTYAADTIAALESAGWTNGIINNDNGSLFAMFTKDSKTVQIVGEAGSTTVSYLSS